MNRPLFSKDLLMRVVDEPWYQPVWGKDPISTRLWDPNTFAIGWQPTYDGWYSVYYCFNNIHPSWSGHNSAIIQSMNLRAVIILELQ